MNNLTEADVKTVSDSKKQISWLRKLVAKHFLSKESSEELSKNPEIQLIFRKYLKTGSISNSEVKQVFQYVKRLFVVLFTVLGTVALASILIFYNPDIGLYSLSWFPLVFVVVYLTFSHYKVQKIILPLDSKQVKEWNSETAFKYTKWWGKKLFKIRKETGSWKF